MVDEVTFAARQLEMLLFGDYRKRIKVKLFTDSESMLEPIADRQEESQDDNCGLKGEVG